MAVSTAAACCESAAGWTLPQQGHNEQETDDAAVISAAEPCAAESRGTAHKAARASDAAAETAPHDDAAAYSADLHFSEDQDEGLDPDSSEGEDHGDGDSPPAAARPDPSFRWRQLPEPDFWGPARSGPLDVAQHALGEPCMRDSCHELLRFSWLVLWELHHTD